MPAFFPGKDTQDNYVIKNNTTTTEIMKSIISLVVVALNGLNTPRAAIMAALGVSLWSGNHSAEMR